MVPLHRNQEATKINYDEVLLVSLEYDVYINNLLIYTTLCHILILQEAAKNYK